MRRAPGPLNEFARAFDREGPPVLEVERATRRRRHFRGLPVPAKPATGRSRDPEVPPALPPTSRSNLVPSSLGSNHPKAPWTAGETQDLEASFTGMDEDHGRDTAYFVERLLFD